MITFKDISIVIPVGRGENALETLLGDLRPIEKEAELIVVRGSSRAKQQNEGARKATRDFLWFLHADSRLTPKTIKALPESLGKDPHALHYFNLRFLPDGPPLMFINEIGCWIRSRILGVPFGDQGFVVSKKKFEGIGGFPEDVPYGEDHLFVWRARQKGIRLQCTGASLFTSARRYAETGWSKLTWAYARRWTTQAWPELCRLPRAYNPSLPPLKIRGGEEGLLLIFAKYPEVGYVKTRLSRTIGEAKAASAYKTMVESVVRKTRPCNGEYAQVLCYDPPEANEKFQSWLQMDRQQPQSRGDLGERMKKALSQALAESKHAVLIGTDCIDVDRSLILKAFQELAETDLVVGPAKDGGYYLIGCKRVYPEIFTGIDWSTKRVFSQTLRVTEKLKLRVSCLPQLEDIDTGEQLWKLKNII